ncbi:MAG: CotH kinase family protein [Bacteroidales bacterium]|nr:CotH kinase family protein [Bacteroidales bacterium]
MNRLGWLLFLVALLSVASCFEQRPAAELRAVRAQQDTLMLPVGGSASFYFTVEEPDYEFDLDKDVALYLAQGQFLASQNFYLEKVERDTVPGRYRAIVKDTGKEDDYVSEVCVGVRFPEGHYKLSNNFLCIGEFGGPMGYVRKTGLPILFVDTENGAKIVSKETYVKSAVRLEDGENVTEPVSCNIRGRGNTTWEWPKKPYLLKFDSKISFFGYPAHKRWVLLANFMDRTMMRNLVSMKVASMTSLAWTPHCRSVELVLNGEHKGNYLLIEQVRVDKNRVNVGDNGYLFESDFHYDNDIQWMDSHGKCVQFSKGIPFAIKSPDSDEITTEQVQAGKDLIARTATAIYGSGFKDPETGYAAYIDVDSFIDYWIVFEVMGNHELGNPGSVYYHWKPGGKLVAGPCWDFDWGVLSYDTSPQARTGFINRNACWYARLFEDPAFAARVKARFNELLPQLKTIPAYIDEMEQYLDRSATENFKMWNPAQDASMNGGRIINGDENLSYHEAVARLRSIYEERLTVIQNNL